MRSDLEVKSDAVNKAQKIIQRFGEKSDQDDTLIQQLNHDYSKARTEAQEKTRIVQDLSQQLADLRQQHSSQQENLQSHMHGELAGLKEAMQDYQQEFERQK